MALAPRLLAIAVTIVAASLPSTGLAQAFPSKVVRLVVPFAAGGSNDVVARAMSQPLRGRARASVENRPGATTIIEPKRRAAPADGHTVPSGFRSFQCGAALEAAVRPSEDFVASPENRRETVRVLGSIRHLPAKHQTRLHRGKPPSSALSNDATEGPNSRASYCSQAGIDMKQVRFRAAHLDDAVWAATRVSHFHRSADRAAIPAEARSDGGYLQNGHRYPEGRPTMIESGFADFECGGMVFGPGNNEGNSDRSAPRSCARSRFPKCAPA